MQEDLWSKLMIAPLFNNSIHGDVLMRRDWIDTCLKYKPQGEVKNVIDMVRPRTSVAYFLSPSPPPPTPYFCGFCCLFLFVGYCCLLPTLLNPVRHIFAGWLPLLIFAIVGTSRTYYVERDRDRGRGRHRERDRDTSFLRGFSCCCGVVRCTAGLQNTEKSSAPPASSCRPFLNTSATHRPERLCARHG